MIRYANTPTTPLNAPCSIAGAITEPVQSLAQVSRKDSGTVHVTMTRIPPCQKGP